MASAEKKHGVEAGSSVLVIGGGIAGISSAYFLGRAGFRVTVLERVKVIVVGLL
jgi:heterodisulfide reductase subunit A-like polyferredoxin